MTQPSQPPPPFAHLASPAVTAASPQHLEQIAEARKRGKTIRRCASVASTSAWTIAIFGAFSVIFSIGDYLGMAIGVAMCVLSHFEFKGAKEIRRLDINAPKRLARNQMIMGALMLVYSAIALWTSLNKPSDIDSALGGDPQLTQMVGSIQSFERSGYIAVYTAIAFAAIVGCGGTALYYARRKPFIKKYLRETPPWIIELQRAGMTV